MERVPCAILGSGNIGTDLMAKLLRSKVLNLVAVVGIDPESEGLARARAAGLDTSSEGFGWLVDHIPPGAFVFDATSASAHKQAALRLIEAGFQLIDLTPAKIGPGIVPVVNLDRHQAAQDVNLISCAGQASIPIVAAVARVSRVTYAEVISTVASAGAGPGTRQNIDEFTHTTAGAIEEVGGAQKGKAIVILNPADPPIMMRNTVFCAIDEEADDQAVGASIRDIVAAVARYVPGYRLKADPVFEPGRVAVFVEVEGAGDYLPKYAGNLDIMTAAAVRVGEDLARSRVKAAG